MLTSVLCLATVIWLEARGEDRLGQELVADTVLNRQAESGASVCSITNAPGQYYHGIIKQDQAWRSAIVLAIEVLSPAYHVKTKATHFATHRLSSRYRLEVHHGHHYFYTRK